MPAWNVLSVENIRRIYDELQDVRQFNVPLVWVNRIPSVEALDEEILARITGRVLAADIIEDDGKAVLRAPDTIRTQQSKVPNLKHGIHLPQSMLRILSRIEAGNADRRENSIFENFIVNQIMKLREGVFARMESIHVAMLQDSFSYDNLGIKMSGVDWDMPSDLKVTSSPVWSGSTGTPITDILTLRRIARQKYGVNLNRVTLSTQAMLHAVATAEFQAMSLPILAALNLADNALAAMGQNTDMMLNLAGRVTSGMIWEIDDRQTWTENQYGTQVASNYQAANKVILTSTDADNNDAYWDWANGEVTETMPGAVPSLIGDFEGPMSGPVGYATAADPQGNPPGIVLWGVGRGFTRRHMEACSAVITAY